MEAYKMPDNVTPEEFAIILQIKQRREQLEEELKPLLDRLAQLQRLKMPKWVVSEKAAEMLAKGWL